MFRAWACLLGALSMLWLVGCGARAARPWNGESMEVPDEAHAYSTDARVEDAATYPGTQQLATDVTAELAKRGHKAVADGALNATARWLLREANQRRTVGPLSADAASRHFGFPGVVHSIAIFDTEQSQTWREALAHIPQNMQLNRFGVSVSPAGRSAAVVFGGV